MNLVKKGVEKIKSSDWQGNLGTALSIASTAVDLIGGFPGSGLVAAGLSAGATLLENKADDKAFNQIKETLEKLSEDQDIVRSLLLAQQKELKEKEVRTDWEEVKKDLLEVIKDVKSSSKRTDSEVDALKSFVDQIFDIVVELRFKVRF